MRGLNVFLALGILFSPVAFAADRLPDCTDNSFRSIPVDNQRVLHLKKSTKNQHKDRANIVGVLVGVLKERESHLHLDVFIGESRAGTGRDSDIEIIHNRAFGAPEGRQLRPGMEIAVCGEFINAFKQAGKYPASPAGAIIHWTHMAPRRDHAEGYLAVDGRLYGQHDPKDRMIMGMIGVEMLDFWKIAN